ncbi:hypothetical protein LNJ06_00310 [Tenacibaculum finnmarkense genomovar ulcerans]|uniref:hypothetical protein n=1 Tax=Tenacibaculum finnmarkense TaxID=2781243 RepID=UPI001E2DA7CD|nr:hypothetical protein [Tenacibaculum finnmarkense]MCD8428631.1 hypothetical protein [Tenacibaculum finnmarkense genomovar ulcerans]
MDENTSKAIFTLMQKVVDKLDAISKEINEKDQIEISNAIMKDSDAIKKAILLVLENQVKLKEGIVGFKNKITSVISENRITPSVTNNTEYNLIGSKSHFKPKILIFMLFSLVIIWSSLKYIPSYFIENSSLNHQKEEYQLFYNYIYLKQFKNDEIISAKEILKKVKEKDSLFMNEYNILLNTYTREIRKKKLKEELNSLNNNDS